MLPMQPNAQRQARRRRLLRSVVLAAALVSAGCQNTSADSPPISTTANEFDVQGHRGARGLQPENTLPAFETALDLGVTTLELDLHYTADGQIVIWHDPVIGPDKCGLRGDAPATIPDPDDPRSHADRAIARLTADQLSWFQCDRNPDQDGQPDQLAGATKLAGDDFRIVTLIELFEFVEGYAGSDKKTESQRDNAARVGFNVETKRRPDDPSTIADGFDGTNAGPFELALLELVNRFELGSRIVVQSFDHRSLWAVHATDSSVPLAALTSTDPVDLSGLAARGASIWSPRASTLTAQRIAEAHDVGLRVIPWTVNDQEEMAMLISIGVDGIITDRPDLLMEQVGEQ